MVKSNETKTIYFVSIVYLTKTIKNVNKNGMKLFDDIKLPFHDITSVQCEHPPQFVDF